jgi:hypothetical protein
MVVGHGGENIRCPSGGQRSPWVKGTTSRRVAISDFTRLVAAVVMAQRKVVEGGLTLATTRKGEEAKEVEQRGDHWEDERLRIGAERSTTCPPGGVLAKDR